MKFNITSFKEILKTIVTLDDTPHKLALSFAVGVYVSVSPFLGIHTVLIIVISFIFGLNKASALAGSWANLPWTIPFVYYSEYRIGEFFLNKNLHFAIKPFTMEHYLKSGRDVFLSIFIGSVVEGVFFGIISYFLLKYLITVYRRRKNVSAQR